MHRFYLSPEEAQASTLTLRHTEAHHALHVLRVRTNEQVLVLDGAGQEFLCEVEALERSAVTLRVLQRHTRPPLPYRVTLAQAVVRSKTMDLIVQKATELGVHRIVPIAAERSVAQIAEGSNKLEKWQATCVESIKQCGSPWLPRIDIPQTARQFLAGGEVFDLMLVASLHEDTRHPRECFQSFEIERQRLPNSVCIWVGPEGDFTAAEIATIRQAGALPITLGGLILRSDTAATYCLSMVNYELQAPSRGPSPL